MLTGVAFAIGNERSAVIVCLVLFEVSVLVVGTYDTWVAEPCAKVIVQSQKGECMSYVNRCLTDHRLTRPEHKDVIREVKYRTDDEIKDLNPRVVGIGAIRLNSGKQ